MGVFIDSREISKPMQDLTLVMAQLDPLVGDIPGNTERAIESVREARIEHGADIVVLPELFLTGYPPEDLLLRPSMESRLRAARTRMAEKVVRDVLVIVGYPGRREGRLWNLAGALYNGEWLGEYAKQALPNYEVFDEQRYFAAGSEPLVLEHKGLKLGLLICEDLWDEGPARRAREAGAQLLVSLNASPFHQDKPAERLRLLEERAAEVALPIVYVNMIGGQDELVFDGGSACVDAEGKLMLQAPHWQVGLMPVALVREKGGWAPRPAGPSAAGAPAHHHRGRGGAGLGDDGKRGGVGGGVLGLGGGVGAGGPVAVAGGAWGPRGGQGVMSPNGKSPGRNSGPVR